MIGKDTPAHWTTLRRLMWLQALQGGGGGGELVTVTGVSPLLLVNALAHSISSLVQYGKCVQDGTDIVCNNGAIKYSPNELDASAENVSIGYYIEKTTGQVRQAQGNSNFMGDAYMPVVAGKSYVAYGRKKNGGELAHYCRIAWYRADKSWISGGNYTENVLTVNTAPANAAYARFSCNPSGTTVVEVTQELVDSYYWVFQEGATEPSVVHPYIAPGGGIYTDGTPETLTVSKADTYTAVDGQGTYVTPGSAANRIYKYIGDTDGDYTISVSTDYDFIVQYRKPADNALPVSSYGNEGSWENGTATVTLDKGAEFGYGISIRLHDSPNGNIAPGDFDGTITIVHNSTAQTVTNIPMLLSVGDYADEGEIISGIKTGKVGIKVYTGEETFNTTIVSQCYADAAPFGVISSLTNRRLVCTHFVSADSLPEQGSRQGVCVIGKYGANCHIAFGATVAYPSTDDFKAWLAAQYAAGTPVIVLYPLAEETTEQTTPHSLHTVKGDNIVVVASNVDPVELSVKFTAGAA